MKITQDPIAVLSADFFPLNVLFAFQIRDDPLHSPLSNPDLQGYFAKHHGGVTGEQDQDMGMVGEKRPACDRLVVAW